MADELNLTVWFHPSMQLPVKIDPEAHPFKVSATNTVVELMDKCEEFFEKKTAELGTPLELQINVLWNIKDHKKALNPNDKLGMHFAGTDSFGVYGDIQPAVVKVAPRAEEDKVPVTILTGFLGSGKTTLLNYILQEQKEKKIAIIENEFGEISIDDALLKQEKMNMAEKIVVMDNGCMCCTIRGDLAKGLQEIIADIKKGGTIDAILIETTGMADPVPIVRTFMSSPEITADLRLDAVITMADAKHLTGRLDDQVEEGKVNEAYQQIAFADKIILNKLDLITTEEAIAVKDRIREINAFAKVIPAIKSRVRMSEIFDIRAHDMCNFVNVELDKEPEAAPEFSQGHGGGHEGSHGEEEHGGGHGGDGGHGSGSGHGPAAGTGHGQGHGAKEDSRHDTRVNSFSIVKEGEIIPRKLSMWMQMLGQLPAEKGTIFRIKAILAVKDHPFKHVFHAVMDVSDEDDAAAWEEGEKRVSKIVFIGKAMDQPFLRRGFEAIFEE
mmetsp:Transcript_71068/g.230709  ORF Transcript_71068/g.230709 Transcript_71068/m.230709 type:complete len:497 (+) Transcript_71068:78-1568(+)|eukprot:CAMPEP_0203917184 /NCGR_PEP_ID=MMETSP0359-20131031/57828_1 /ASSEMBLY_ACC=CAM_ASM_000338 /TAXON_ID=268821 /ORGANISM="Scrippsiella Hangoei, Strain SHTV-5" /LENGTH=496 /DNA_ID=CAMNT_0050844029 /DNA_START=66 /DNA_END=1556 /DNA_ORIENTATION=-